MQIIREFCASAHIILVGNKSDLGSTTVSKEELHQFLAFNQIEYFETSALNGTDIKKIFDALFVKCLLI